MDLWIIGGGAVTAKGYGRLSEGKAVRLVPGRPAIPPPDWIFDRPLPRYGRFDAFARLGCAAVALALKDAGLNQTGHKRPIGVVASSRYESLETDFAYLDTAIRDGGALASPNLFSYTLPGIFVGECAVHFGLTGPTLCVGEQEGLGLAALRCAATLMADGGTETMLAGCVDAPPAGVDVPADAAPAALFVVLQSKPGAAERPNMRLRHEGQGRLVLDGGVELTSLAEVFSRAVSRLRDERRGNAA